MDAKTLLDIVPSCPTAGMDERLAGYDWCASIVRANTVARCAMLIAMVAEESASFHATAEYASGWEYDITVNREKALELGNTQRGDGPRFRGSTYIQTTGRSNFGRASRWCHQRGLVPTSTYFVDHPDELRELKYAWVGPAVYWLGDHNHGYGSINAAADAHDVEAATRMVNGGMNGYETRYLYWRRAMAAGSAILPTPVVPEETPDVFIYKCGHDYFEFQAGAIVHHRSGSYARNLAALSGQSRIGTASRAQHERMVLNQREIVKGR